MWLSVQRYRLEAGLPLHGQDLTPEISPIEARIGFAVKVDKGDFIGQPVLKEQKNGAPRRLSAFEITERNCTLLTTRY